MAQRQLAERQITNIVATDDRRAEMFATGAKIADAGLQLKQKQDQANMNNFAAQSNLEIMKITNDWRIENESNPTDPKALDTLHQKYDSVLGQYDDKVGFLSRGDWGAVKNKIKTGYQEQNLTWGLKQSVKNAETSINTAIKTNLQMASEFGRTGDITQARSHFSDASAGLNVFADGVLGDETKTELTKDFKADYIKSFLVGQAEVNPDGALAMLENKEVRADIGDEKDILSIKAFASKQKKIMTQRDATAERVSVDDEYQKIINGESSFAQIDSRVGPGGYSAEKAQFLKRVLVKAEPEKDNKLTIAKYIDALSNLPIDNQEEAHKVFEAIMEDSDIKDNTKSVLLYETDLGSVDAPASLSDLSSGKVKKPGPWFWGWFQSKANTNDAVDAFLKFKNGLKGNESMGELKARAQRAITDVSSANNTELSGLTSEWSPMIDANGTEFMARINDDGIIETDMVGDAGGEDDAAPGEGDGADGD